VHSPIGATLSEGRPTIGLCGEIAIVFSGSKKSLVTGIPMANALFPDVSLGLVVLPLIVFHQLQLMTCATLAQRYALAGARHTPGP
jgi:sodium/bile acid cotransporter 7